MLKAEIKIGHVYLAKIRGKLCRVKIEQERMIRVRNARTGSYRERASGWVATNLETKRVIVIKSAMRLFSEAKDDVGPTKKLLALGAVTPAPQTTQDTLAIAQATIDKQIRDARRQTLLNVLTRIEKSYVNSITPEKQTQARELLTELQSLAKDEATPVWAPDDARKTLRGVLKRIDDGRLDVDELLTAFCRCYPDATPGGAK